MVVVTGVVVTDAAKKDKIEIDITLIINNNLIIRNKIH